MITRSGVERRAQRAVTTDRIQDLITKASRLTLRMQQRTGDHPMLPDRARRIAMLLAAVRDGQTVISRRDRDAAQWPLDRRQGGDRRVGADTWRR